MQLSHEPVSTLMTPQPVSLDRDAVLDDVLRTFAKYPFRHLPVTGGNELLGILSDRDVLLATGWLADREREIDAQTPSPRAVRDIMHTSVHTLAPDATVGDAARIMLRERIGALPIVDDVGLLGIVTETDLLRALCDTNDISTAAASVGELMQDSVTTVEGDEDLLSAADVLFRSRIRHLPVLRDGKVVGMLSDRDVRLGLARLSWQDSRLEHEGDAGVPQLAVSDVMTTRPFTVETKDSLARAIGCMVEERVGALPVVEEGRLMGILSRTDLLELFLGDPVAARA